MTAPWDIVIAGGGLSGLALAAELAAPELSGLSVLVLEKRSSYQRDRTWSYWTPTERPLHRYHAIERQRWSQWSVSSKGQTCTHRSAQQAYASIDANDFYQAAQQTISTAAHITLRMGCGVAQLQNQRGLTQVTTEQGETLLARHVLDARPSTKVSPSALVQQFAGWEIHTAHDAFDPQTVQLMAFEPSAQGLHFWYVLPYSARNALVESTWISPAQWQPDYEAELRAYLHQQLGGQPYDISYREQGVLPLDAQAHADPATTGLGRAGGTLRPSTGYAFVNTLAHAQQIASSLTAAVRTQSLATWQAPRFERTATESWMDAVFLQALSRNWQQAPQYFMQLFGAVPADDVVAFLAGKVSAGQRLRVMRSLPVWPFATAALAQGWKLR